MNAKSVRAKRVDFPANVDITNPFTLTDLKNPTLDQFVELAKHNLSNNYET
jgi:hypothetical protein